MWNELIKSHADGAVLISNAVVMSEYVGLLKVHDWSHEFSDDGAAYRAGRHQRQVLNTLRKQIDPDYVVWNNYAPRAYQNGRQGVSA